MSKLNNHLLIMLTGIMICFSQPLQAQFLTLARKIKSMNSDGKDVATVIIDAGASRVYQAVNDTIDSDPKCKVLKREPSRMLVEFTHDASAMTVQVDSLDAGLSQITVLAQHSANARQKTTDVAAGVIISVCRKVGINCTLK